MQQKNKQAGTEAQFQKVENEPAQKVQKHEIEKVKKCTHISNTYVGKREKRRKKQIQKVQTYKEKRGF